MRVVLFLFFSLITNEELSSQIPTCASSYDTQFNNDFTPTHYFPGPMSIPFNTNINGRIEISNDIDYYKFTVTTGGTITLTLNNLPADYNLRLVNSNGNAIATSARKGTSNEAINFTVLSNTVYYALVYPAGRRVFNANACYTLRVTTGTASRPALAFSEQAGIYPNPAVSSLNLRLPDQEGVKQIRIINSSGSVVLRQNTMQPVVSLSLSSLPSGIYFVNVFGDKGKLIYRERLIKD